MLPTWVLCKSANGTFLDGGYRLDIIYFNSYKAFNTVPHEYLLHAINFMDGQKC